jgi:transcriptional regulator with XRE-family HTH domain
MDRDTRLKPHRKRSGFTQKELAFLLGNKKHSAISRYEGGGRKPDLRTALAYKLLFESQLQDLFPGVYADVAREIGERAERLSQEIRQGGYNGKATYKLKILARLQREGLDGGI